ncbi:hypothetical protein WISP_124247 [Willisornis vidua]|uniref:Uncharacterized protein n=1 Tax=Willisornis vidua TaxID=1566151 RepID=A0ABQ9CWW0_9PASS|nr:hypothetical protein WISP_124247 [Willisornis vidua]
MNGRRFDRDREHQDPGNYATSFHKSLQYQVFFKKYSGACTFIYLQWVALTSILRCPQGVFYRIQEFSESLSSEAVRWERTQCHDRDGISGKERNKCADSNKSGSGKYRAFTITRYMKDIVKRENAPNSYVGNGDNSQRASDLRNTAEGAPWFVLEY